MAKDPIEQALETAFQQGQISRRQFITGMIAAGMGLGGVGVLAACGSPAAPTAAPPTAAAAQPTAAAATAMPAQPTAAGGAASTRGLTPTFYQWIIDLHPSIKTDINPQFADLNFQIAPVQGFDVARFVAEAKQGKSTWDVYVGMTPFVEMAGLIKAGVIEPWDNYIPKEIIDDLIPSIRNECTVDGKLYSWPFLLDIIVQGYNADLTTKAGIADTAPTDWDTYLANAKTVLDKGVAQYGCTFDAHGWRSLAPITHSISTKTYYNLDGDKSGVPLFDFTSDPAVQALQIMKQMLDLSSANALQPGSTDGGVNQTPDEVAFSAQKVAYYIKYQNAPLRMARSWSNPKALRLGALPKTKDGEGATVFWTTGACLFKNGENKEKAAAYMKALTTNPKIWADSIGGSASGQPGQLPPYQSIYAGWKANPPDFLKANPWVDLVFGQLQVAKAIPNHAYGLQQFVLGQPLWEKYLKGDEKDPKAALKAAKDAVAADVLKNQ
jgi:ABC-type glycerol-3-phosphate transport system substrate-binding protein